MVICVFIQLPTCNVYIWGLFERAELLELVHTSVHFCVRVGSAAYTFAVRVAGASAASVTSCKNLLPLLGNECNWVQTIDSRAALSVYVCEKGVIDPRADIK